VRAGRWDAVCFSAGFLAAIALLNLVGLVLR
jgi:hypothetical protein